MLLHNFDEPLFIPLPQDSGDLSVGWTCFQKLFISSLGYVERSHREKGFHNLPQPYQQRSDPGTGFLAWQCTGIKTKPLQGRAVWRGRAEKHQMEKQCCSVNIDRCSLLSLQCCCTDPLPCCLSGCHSAHWSIASLHLRAPSFKAGFCICSGKWRAKRGWRNISTQDFAQGQDECNPSLPQEMRWKVLSVLISVHFTSTDFPFW